MTTSSRLILRIGLLVACVFCASTLHTLAARAAEPPAGFAAWTPETFARARKERRILLVMVSTSWCHWCHVMKRETYKQPQVRAVLAQSFLPIYVDADARPDLAERFRNYRWPATAFLTPDAQPILALRGYRGPEPFLRILNDVRQQVRRGGPYKGFIDPNRAGAAVQNNDDATVRRLRDATRAGLDKYWDPVQGGWGDERQKYPVPEPITYGLLRRHLDGAASSIAHRRAAITLDRMQPLIDREWGGVYQYSVGSSWSAWHPEKIMKVNAGALWNYAELYAQTRDARWQRAALDVLRWFEGFMTDTSGGFYTSQDADAPRLPGEQFYRLSAQARRAGGYGVPHVDTAIYARENGWALQAYAHAIRHVASGTHAARLLAHANATADRILREHQNPHGTLRHAKSGDRIYLEDQTAFARGLLALHALDPTGPRLAQAQRIVQGTRAQLMRPAGGFYDVSKSQDPGVFARRLHSLEVNADAARLLLALAAWTKAPELRDVARRTILSVGNGVRIRGYWRDVAGLLIAADVALRPFIHIEVHGAPQATAVLWAHASQHAAAPHIVVSRVPPGDADARGSAFAVVCGEATCSEPVTTPTELAQAIRAQQGIPLPAGR